METNNKLETLHTVAEALILVRDEAVKRLNAAGYGHIKISIEAGLNRLINQVKFHSGQTQSEVRSASKVLSPLTEFMGEKIVRETKEVKAEDLNPDEERKRKFTDKVNHLEKVMFEISDDTIFETYRSPEDRLVIRGVAKRAGLEDYKTADLNNEYIQKIREGLVAQQELKEKTAATEKKLDNLEDEDQNQ